jgi:hypothetical protein
MTNHLILLLLQHPRLAGIAGLFIAVLFAILGISSLQEMSRLPAAPSELTTAQFAGALQSQDRVWAIIQNPQWDCSTLVNTTTGEDTDTEIFIRDPENSVAILVTFTDPTECAALDPTQVTGVGYPISEKYKQILEQEGRLAPVRDYKTLVALCTTCGRENSLWLIVLSGIFVVVGLAMYPLASLARRTMDQQAGFSNGSGWWERQNETRQEVQYASTETLELTVYRYEVGYFRFIGEDHAEVREFQTLIATRDIAILHRKCSKLLKAFAALEYKAGHHGPPMLMDYYPDYELYVNELHRRKTSGLK